MNELLDDFGFAFVADGFFILIGTSAVTIGATFFDTVTEVETTGTGEAAVDGIGILDGRK